MLLKYFWIFIGSSFACSVALVFLVKNFAQGFAANAKRPILFGSFSAAGASGGAYLATLIDEHMFTVYWIFSGIFLLFGIIHVIFFHKKYFYSNKNDHGKVFMGEILFALSLILFTVVIFSTLQYFLKDKNFLFYPMLLSMLCFFIPILFVYTFESAYKIPVPVFTTWQYPIHEPIDLPDEKINEKLVVIAFEIAKQSSEYVKTNFRAKGPEAMLLGDLYYHFVNDYNELHSETPIEYTDEYHNPQEWWFRAKPKWYQPNRILNPELTIKDNHIKEDTIIICERIVTPEEEA